MGEGEEKEAEEEGKEEEGGVEERFKGVTTDGVSVDKCENVEDLNITDNILQVDGNVTVASYTSSDSESEAASEVDLMNSSSEEENMDSENEQDTEGEPDEDDDDSTTEDEEVLIPVIVGNRPAPIAHEAREPVRKTIKRNNKLVNALSAPNMTLYNVRSAWAKWSNISDDMDVRETDLSFYTEIWEQSENKNHQKAIESPT